MELDAEAEGRAFAVLGRALATNPGEALQRVADCALTLCRADAAGITQLEAFGDHELVRTGRSDPGAKEILILPWSVDGVPVGTIFVARTFAQPFDEGDVRQLQILATYASTAWQLRTAGAGAERLRGLFRQAPGFMAILRGPDHVFEFYNDAYMRLVGPRDLIGHPAREAFPEVEGQGFFEWLDNVYRSGGAHIGHATPLRLQAPGRPLKQMFVDFVFQAITDGSGRTTGIFIEGHDVTDQVLIATALKESETRLRTLTEGIPQLVWRAVDEGEWTWSSPQWQACTGQGSGQSNGRGWLRAVHREDHEAVLQAWSEARSRGSLEVEHRVRRASDGAWLWHHTRALPVKDAAGEIIEWLGTSTEVQQLKKMQDRQSLLVSELQHRTRNLIAVVRSIAEQTMSTSTSLQEFESAFDDRLAALGRVQALLSRADADPITIETLVRMELDSVGAFGSDEHAISLRGPHVPIRESIVQTLALALHELATNARKHGALAAEGGRLKVSWSVAERPGAGVVLGVQWIEERPATISVPDSSPAGFGRYLLERALPHLGAATHFELGTNGARCDIEVPLRQPAAERQPSSPAGESGFS